MLCLLRRVSDRPYLALLALAAGLILPPTPARAQDYMGMAELYGQGVVNSLGNQIRSAGIRSSMGQRGKAAERTPRAPRKDPPQAATHSPAPRSGSATNSPASAPPNYQALRFRSSAAVTDALAERFADTLAPALVQGRSRQDIATLVRGGQLQDGFRRVLQPYGFSDRDVADVLASHMVMIWQVANDQTSQSPRAHVMAVRDQTREALARAPWVQAMEDGDKQRFAETLSVGTMMIVGRYVNGYDTKNRTTITMAIRDANDMARSFANIDMTRYALTAQGLVERRQ